jgi:hypothetical protein
MAGLGELGRGGVSPVGSIYAFAWELPSMAGRGEVAGDALSEVRCMNARGSVPCGCAWRLNSGPVSVVSRDLACGVGALGSIWVFCCSPSEAVRAIIARYARV